MVPFQVRAHEPFLAVWRKARLKYLASDFQATAGMLSVVQVSKYGAYTCRGQIRNAVLACTVALACAAGWARTDAARSAAAISASTNRRAMNRRVTEHQVTRCLLTKPTQPAELTDLTDRNC